MDAVAQRPKSAQRTATPPPAITLRPDGETKQALDAAAEQGRSAARDWIATHRDGTINQFQRYLLGATGGPPSPEVERRELQKLYDLAAIRTPDEDLQAQWLDGNATTMWKQRANELGASGTADALQGAALLKAAGDVTNSVSWILKKQYMRPRPFEADPNLPRLPETSHATGGSFPSGHSSRAYAMSEVYNYLTPDKAPELSTLAQQIAYSRQYAGVHYLSDTTSGAFIGSAVGAFLVEKAKAGEVPAAA